MYLICNQQVTGPYYGALFSLGENRRYLERFHAGLNTFEKEIKDRGGIYFGGKL